MSRRKVGAAKELSTRGDEGRARAVFEIWMRLAPDAEKGEIKGHLDALAAWMKDAVSHGGPVASAGALETAAVSRRLLEPSQPALDEAAAKTIDWVDKAFELRANANAQRKSPPPREEVGEALRALQTGGTVLAALYLRDADARGALAAIDKAQARDLVRPELLAALTAAADKPDAERWIDVLHALQPPRDPHGEEEEGGEERLDAAGGGERKATLADEERLVTGGRGDRHEEPARNGDEARGNDDEREDRAEEERFDATNREPDAERDAGEVGKALQMEEEAGRVRQSARREPDGRHGEQTDADAEHPGGRDGPHAEELQREDEREHGRCRPHPGDAEPAVEADQVAKVGARAHRPQRASPVPAVGRRPVDVRWRAASKETRRSKPTSRISSRSAR